MGRPISRLFSNPVGAKRQKIENAEAQKIPNAEAAEALRAAAEKDKVETKLELVNQVIQTAFLTRSMKYVAADAVPLEVKYAIYWRSLIIQFKNWPRLVAYGYDSFDSSTARLISAYCDSAKDEVDLLLLKELHCENKMCAVLKADPIMQLTSSLRAKRISKLKDAMEMMMPVDGEDFTEKEYEYAFNVLSKHACYFIATIAPFPSMKSIVESDFLPLLNNKLALKLLFEKAGFVSFSVVKSRVEANIAYGSSIKDVPILSQLFDVFEKLGVWCVEMPHGGDQTSCRLLRVTEANKRHLGHESFPSSSTSDLLDVSFKNKTFVYVLPLDESVKSVYVDPSAPDYESPTEFAKVIQSLVKDSEQILSQNSFFFTILYEFMKWVGVDWAMEMRVLNKVRTKEKRIFQILVNEAEEKFF